MSSVLRLLWALPLVLAVGAVMMIVLRRFVVPTTVPTATRRLIARESMPLSNDTRAHLIEVDGVSYLVVESALNSVHALTLQSQATREMPARLQPAWLRRLSGTAR
jgi:flagellar biogenesis protein FliO